MNGQAMTSHRDDDTERIESGVCMGHSGMTQRMRSTERSIEALWKAVGEIRAMMWTILVATAGTLGLTVLSMLRDGG